MDKAFWTKAVALWVKLRTNDDISKTRETADKISHSSIVNRQQEKSMFEELMSGFDEEDDDDY